MTSAAGRRGHPRLFLVERAQPGTTASELEVAQRALVEISRRSTRNGAPLRYLRTLFLPGQSRCLSVFEALSADAVRAANEAAQLPFARVEEVIELTS